MNNLLTIVKLSREDLVIDPLTRIACIYCSQFNKTWSCPPIGGFKIDTLFKKLEKYRNVYLIIFYFPELYHKVKFGKYEKLHIELSRRVLLLESYCRKITMNIMYRIQKNVNGLLFKTGGGCTKCDVCNYTFSKPCKYPHDLVYSPEACSINIYKTLSKLGIVFEHPVRNFIIKVGMLFTNNEINIEQIDVKPFTYIDVDVLRKEDIYKLLGIEKRLSTCIKNVDIDYVILEKHNLIDLISTKVDYLLCSFCGYRKICSLLRESIDKIRKYCSNVQVLKCRVRKFDNYELYKLWHIYAQKHSIALLLFNKFIKFRQKYVTTCMKLLYINQQLNRNEVLIILD